MKPRIHRRVTVLIAAGAIGSGLVGLASTSAASASSSASAGTADKDPACTAYQDKYKARLVTSYKILGGNDSVHDISGGTLQLWASDACGTAWVKTVKLPQYAGQPQLTVAAITSRDDPEQKRSETVTSADLESPAASTGQRSGELHVEGGFLGGNYQFDANYTFQY